MSEYNDKTIPNILISCQNKIDAVALIHRELYQSPDLSNVDLVSFVGLQKKHLINKYKLNDKNIVLKTNKQNFFIDINFAVPCALILNELISNSMIHGFKDRKEGEINIMLKNEDNYYSICVANNGNKLSEGYNLHIKKSSGLGLVSVLLQQLHGSMTLKVDDLTKFIVTFQNRNLHNYRDYKKRN